LRLQEDTGRRTVESHLYSIYRKLVVKNRLQLARLAAAETEREAPLSIRSREP
jgi:DNA-binding CsgD family transcriptional regulator